MKLGKLLREKFNGNLFFKFRNYQNVYNRLKKGSSESLKENMKKSMKQKIEDNLKKAAKNVEINTPRVIGALFFILSLPQFFFLYDIMMKEYNDKEFLDKIRLSIEWFNIKTACATGLIFGLEAMKFCDRKAKFKVPKSNNNLFFLLIPLSINLLSLSYFNILEKKIIATNIIGDVSLMLIEGKLTNEGLLPYWYFNMRYQVHLMDILNLIILYYAMKRLRSQIDKKPKEFFDL